MMNDFDGKTVVRTRGMPFRPAPHGDREQSLSVLPIGTHMGEFEIVDLIGEGGFGIVYLAYDHSLERNVALKEYMPSGLATRTTKMAVTVRSEHNADTFTAGLKSFINEAKMLAQFDSPSLVKVHRFWEGNGTAYMVMPFYEGTTLKQAFKERRITPTEPWIRLLLADLFDAIEIIHGAQCLHRDIAPDNILLLKDGRPLLLDFGAARRVIGDLTQCLTAILKPGYAPIEQYADIAGLRQGPWTDIYALAAVVYYLITGKAPPPAVARMVRDELVPAREAGKGRYSKSFLSVLDKALAVRPEQRFKSIAEVRRALDIMEAVPRTLPDDTSGWATTVIRTAPLAEPKAAPRPAAQANPAFDERTQIAPKMEPKAEPKPQSKPQSGFKPKAKAEAKPELKADVKPEAKAKPEAKEKAKPEAYSQAAPQPASDWRKTAWADEAAGYQPRRARTEWLVLGFLLCAGIASGVYWGTTRTWTQPAGDPPPASAQSSATTSSGASEAAEEESSAQGAAAPPATTAAVPPVATAPEAKEKEATGPKPEPPQSAPPAAAAAQSEIELWRMASRSDKANAYENYLKEYPKGRYADLARLRLERIHSRPPALVPPVATQPQESKPRPAAPAAAAPAAAPKATPSGEEDLWTTVTTINEAPAYEAYLHQYPRGRYAALAKDRLANARPEAAAPALPSSAAEKPLAPQAPQQTPAERPAQEPTDKLASIKPPEPSVPATPKPAAEAAPKQVPEAPTASARKSIRIGDQTMTGNFSVDPKTGVVSGTGKIVWNNGNQFEGTLVRGIKEGKGKFVWHDGQRYTGDWARDMPNGKGTVIFTDGSRYDGEMKDGAPHGHGISRFKDGDVYNGNWVRGKSHGQGRYTWANGSYWEGEFRNDKRTENGTMVFAGSAADKSAAPGKEAGAQ